MTGLKASLLMIVGFAMTGAFHHAPGGMQTAMWGKGQTTTKTKTIHGRTTSRLEGRGPRMMTMMEPSKICVLRSPWTTDEAAEAAASKLRLRGFPVDIVDDDGGADGQGGVCYRWQPATGMFCLLDQANGGGGDLLPKWVSPQGSEETFLEERGWGFISRPDASDGEQMSAFDIDAANLEGKYKPAWGQGSGNAGEVSALGFNITVMDAWEVSGATSSLCEVSIAVLIRGETETPGRKLTACEQAVAYTAGMRGTFCCAVSGLPLFCTDSLTADTATSGWLSFVAPVDPTHVITRTDTGHGQVRTEALCARSRCHLGHFFPPNSWCINAASLTFHPSSSPLPPPSRPLGPLPSSAPSPLTDSLFMPPLERTIIAAGATPPPPPFPSFDVSHQSRLSRLFLASSKSPTYLPWRRAHAVRVRGGARCRPFILCRVRGGHRALRVRGGVVRHSACRYGGRREGCTRVSRPDHGACGRQGTEGYRAVSQRGVCVAEAEGGGRGGCEGVRRCSEETGELTACSWHSTSCPSYPRVLTSPILPIPDSWT